MSGAGMQQMRDSEMMSCRTTGVRAAAECARDDAFAQFKAGRCKASAAAALVRLEQSMN